MGGVTELTRMGRGSADYTRKQTYWRLLKLTVCNIEGFVQMKTSFDLEKNDHHRPSSLGHSSIVVVRQ